MRTDVATISRANGNNRRGHSINTNGCRLSAGHVHDAKHAGKDQFEAVQHQAVGFRLALQTQRHLEVGLAHGRGFDVDLNVDRRLLRARRQRTRRVRVLERQILHILPENGDLRHRHLWLGAAICRRHTDLRRARALPAWLTQGREANNGGRPAAARGDNAANFGAPAQMTANIASSPRAWAAALKIPAPAMLARRRQSFRLSHGRAVVMSSGLWMAPRACLHNEWEPGSRLLNRGFGLSLRNASFRQLRCRENVKRVRHLHHHLSGARSIHFPAASQRLGPTHRARAAALRPVFGARRGAQPGDRQGRNADAAARRKPRPARPSRRRPRASAGRASPKAARPSRPGSMRSRRRTRVSMRSISSPARAPPTR